MEDPMVVCPDVLESEQGGITRPVCQISAVQLVEVEGKLLSEGSVTPAEMQAERTLPRHVLQTRPFLPGAARAASFCYARRRPYTLSLGDALCLGKAETLGADVLTAERAWAAMPDLPVQVQLIR